MTVQAKHTAGPWHIAADAENPLHLIWTEADAKNSPGTLLARTCFAFDSEANARLIASAPDLLEALKRLLESAEVWERHTQGKAFRLHEANTVRDARAAIAKAEGR